MVHPPAAENPLRTRADVQRLAVDLIHPLVGFFTPGRAGVRLGEPQPWYGEPAASLEGYARPLWGLVPLAMGGGTFEHWALWREGLINGTDPAHSEFWGWPADRDQRDVELPAIALGAALLPAELWDPLSREQQDRVAIWLERINAVEMADNNWRFFRVLANAALRRLGRNGSAEQIATDLRRIDSFYLGDGWYADGLERRGDYYVPMAFHFYSLLFTSLATEAERPWVETMRDRARLFARTFQHWFTADGEAIPFGRSLTYRFAQGAVWGACAYAGEPVLPWGELKGLYLRHLRWWMRQPIFNAAGILSVGYRYPTHLMAENYNGAGSPYWACKALLPLALPESHPFWQADETALPPSETVITVPPAGLVVTANPARTLVVALNAGQPVVRYPRHAAAKYSKFAYATHFGFSVPSGDTGALTAGGYDSVLALSDDGVRFRARDTCLEPEVSGGVARALWRPWPDVEVRTALIAIGTHHLRLHRIQTQRKLWSSDAGFAVGCASPTAIRPTVEAGSIVLRSPVGVSGVRDLLTKRGTEQATLEPGTHLSFPLAAMPTLRAEHSPGIHWLATIVGADPVPETKLETELAAYALELTDQSVRLQRNGAIVFTSDVLFTPSS